MTIDTNNSRHIIAEQGKIFKRISDGFIFGNEIFLGFTYYIDGVLLDEPLAELPEHFEEIDKPVEITETPIDEFQDAIIVNNDDVNPEN